jgi:hypothetical protein
MVNLGCVPTPDWNQEFVREQVLQLRHERWRTNSIHILKLARKLAIAWLLLRHGTDITDAIITITSAPPNLLAR